MRANHDHFTGTPVSFPHRLDILDPDAVHVVPLCAGRIASGRESAADMFGSR